MKAIQIIIGSVIFHTTTAAINFNQQCLCLSDQTVGIMSEANTSMNNDVQFFEMDSRARPVSMKTCFNGKKNGPVTGVMFTVRVPGDDDIDLPMIGNEGRNCKTLTLTNPITHIEVSTDNGVVDAIKWVVFPNQKTYGDYNISKGTEWIFTQERPVIGLYGQVNDDNEITQLGFVTASPYCVEIREEEAAAVEPLELTFNSEANMKEDDDDKNDDGMTSVIITILVIVIIIVAALVSAVFYMRGIGNKETTLDDNSVKANPPQRIPHSSATPNGTDTEAECQSMDNDLTDTARGGSKEKGNTEAVATAGTDGAYKK